MDAEIHDSDGVTEKKNNTFTFPALVVGHAYFIREYPRLQRRNTAQKKSLGYKKGKTRFFIYNAVSKSQWLKNHWYCLFRLSLRDQVLKHDESNHDQSIMACLDEAQHVLEQQKKQRKDISLQEKFIKFLTHYSACKNSVLDEPEKKNSYNHYLLTKQESALCDKTLEKFISFLCDDDAVLYLGPMITYEYLIHEQKPFRKKNETLEYASQDFDLDKLLKLWPEHDTKYRLKNFALFENVEDINIYYTVSPSSSPENNMPVMNLVTRSRTGTSKMYKIQ